MTTFPKFSATSSSTDGAILFPNGIDCGHTERPAGACNKVFAGAASSFIERGYSPIPRFMIEGKMRWPKAWSDYCDRQPNAAELAKWSAVEADIALCGGYRDFMAIDVDWDDPKFKKAVLGALPYCRIARFGSKGFALFVRYRGDYIPNIYSADETRKEPVIEFKGSGGNISVPPSAHAKTGRPYIWLNPETGEQIAGPPAVDDLPLVTPDGIRWLKEAVVPWSRKPRQPRPVGDGKTAYAPNSATEKRYQAYALAGLECATANLAGLKQGRPTELFRAVCSLGWAVAHHIINEADFVSAFLAACKQNGLAKREGDKAIIASIKSGLSRSANDPLPELKDRPKEKTGEGARRDDDAREASREQPKNEKGDLDLKAEVDRLANMDALEYELVRKAEAERLGLRASILDQAVAKRRAELFPPEPEGLSGFGEPLEPWPHPVDGRELVKELTAAIQSHVVLHDHQALAVALWILHAHAHDAAIISAILAVVSPEKRCGKTTLLSLLQELTPNAILAANITAAAVFRALEEMRLTLLLDEADTYLAEREELRGVINSGHNRRSANILRVVEEGGKQVVKRFPTWAPKAIAMIKDLPDTLQDRSVAIRLRRKLPGETVARFRADRVRHLEDINRRSARWAADNLEALRAIDAETPNGLHDRAADNWRFLLGIAEHIGGDCKDNAQAACMAIEGVNVEADVETEVSDGVKLLVDCKTIFEERNAKELSAKEIIASLVTMEESHWADYRAGKVITEKAFANLLKPFGVKSERESKGVGKGKKVWRKEAFIDAWKRYIPQNGEKSAEQPSPPFTPLKNKENFESEPFTTVNGCEDEKLNEINAVNDGEGQNPDFPPFSTDIPDSADFDASDDDICEVRI
jgi:putative DNA primase/helicase